MVGKFPLTFYVLDSIIKNYYHYIVQVINIDKFRYCGLRGLWEDLRVLPMTRTPLEVTDIVTEIEDLGEIDFAVLVEYEKCDGFV